MKLYRITCVKLVSDEELSSLLNSLRHPDEEVIAIKLGSIGWSEPAAAPEVESTLAGESELEAGFIGSFVKSDTDSSYYAKWYPDDSLVQIMKAEVV